MYFLHIRCGQSGICWVFLICADMIAFIIMALDQSVSYFQFGLVVKCKIASFYKGILLYSLQSALEFMFQLICN